MGGFFDHGASEMKKGKKYVAHKDPNSPDYTPPVRWWEWAVLIIGIAVITGGILAQAFCGGKHGPWAC